MTSVRGSGMPSGIARSSANMRAPHFHTGSNRPPVAASTTLATLPSRGAAELLAGRAALVVSGARGLQGRGAFPSRLFGGSPVVAVREANRLGNGENAEKLQSSAGAGV